MTDKTRRSVLFVALAGVAAWSIWLAITDRSNGDAGDRIDVAEPVAHASRPAHAVQVSASVAVRAKPQEAEPRLALSRTNLFPEQTWYVPPPPPPYVPPPPPQAPALPFSYMGRWQEAGQTTYYLARGIAPVSVHAGQVLDGVWRLEPVTGGMLNFTYLPLNQTRSLRAGD